MTLSDLVRDRGQTEDGPGVRERPPHIRSRRAGAALLNTVIILAPLAVGALVLYSLADLPAVGSADRVVFGGAALLTSISLLVAVIGWGRGQHGASVGDRWFGLVVRAADGGPLGVTRALNPFSARDILMRWDAEAQGLTIVPPKRTRARRLGLLASLGLLLAFLLLASLAVGSRALGITDVIGALLPPYSGAASDAALIVRELRLPRTLTAIVVGAALGTAGASIQGHTRNPLADPGLLGVSAGSACAVVLAISLLGASTPLEFIWFAFAGALVASVLVFGLSSIGEGIRSPLTLILAGAALAAVLGSITSAIVLIDESALDSYRFWIVGSLGGRGLDILLPLAPFFVIGLALAFAGAQGLNLLTTGDDVARALGLNVTAHRVLGLAAITVLTGAATAACGPIGFIGLVAPHMARALVGADYRWAVPTAASAGAVLLLASDVVGRVLARPAELQVGVVVALVGAPFFIALIRRRNPVPL